MTLKITATCGLKGCHTTIELSTVKLRGAQQNRLQFRGHSAWSVRNDGFGAINVLCPEHREEPAPAEEKPFYVSTPSGHRIPSRPYSAAKKGEVGTDGLPVSQAEEDKASQEEEDKRAVASTTRRIIKTILQNKEGKAALLEMLGNGKTEQEDTHDEMAHDEQDKRRVSRDLNEESTGEGLFRAWAAQVYNVPTDAVTLTQYKFVKGQIAKHLEQLARRYS